jgi:hypothetical protein
VQVKRGLRSMGEDELLEAVEGFERKYAKLKEKSKRVEAELAAEADELAGQLADAQVRTHPERRAGGKILCCANDVLPSQLPFFHDHTEAHAV